MVKAIDEAAQAVASRFSTSVAADVIEVTLASDDYEHDIPALLNMDAVVKQVTDELPAVEVTERFNPLFIPQKMGELDEMLELQIRNDAVRFTGLDGSPFTIKLTDVKSDDSTLVMAKTQYHPFELPSYTEIVDAHEQTYLN